MGTTELRTLFSEDQTITFKGDTNITVPEGWSIADAAVVVDNPFMLVVSAAYNTGTDVLDEKELILRRPAPVVFATRQGDHGREVLVVDQVRHGAGCTVRELPGGMGKKGETSAQIAARELSEEGGLQVDSSELELIGTVYRDVARSPGLMASVFYVEVSPDAPTTTPVVEHGEHIDGRQWVPLTDLIQSLANGQLKDAVLMSALGIVLARQKYGL